MADKPKQETKSEEPKVTLLPEGIEARITITIDEKGKSNVNYVDRNSNKPGSAEVAHLIFQVGTALLAAAIAQTKAARQEKSSKILIADKDMARRLLDQHKDKKG